MSVTTEVFHKNGASKNIELIKNGKRAKRKDASSLDGSVVFSKSPLRPDVKYEVKLIDASCTTYLHVGVTIDDPQAEDVRWTYWRVVDDVSWRLLDQSNTWVREEHMGWCGRVVRACGKPLQVDIGDTVAVMRTSNDEIHFIVNGEDQGLSFLVGPHMRIWAVVEMETTGKVIALPPYDGPAAARSRIRRPVVERSDSHASGDQVSLDEEDLDEQRSLLQCFGDMGISQGATAAEIDENLEPAAFNMRAGKNIILRDNYTTAKRRGIANIGQAIVFTAQPLQDDVMFQANVEGISGETYINMGVTPINPAYLEDHSIPERLFKMRCDSCVLNMNNLFYDGVYLRPYGSDSHRTVSRGDKVGILKTASGDIHFYQNGANMGKALSNREGPLWGIFEILEDDLILQAASSGSRTVPLLPEGTDMYGQSQQGDYSTDEDNELISQARGMTPEPVEPPASVLTPPPTPAEPTVVTPPPSSPVSPPPASPVSPPPAAAPVPVPAPAPVPECPYKSICTKFINSLELGDDLFQKNFDTCFCLSCHQRRGDNFYYERGQPAKTYGIPIGWCKFGLHAPPRANMLNVFTKWHMAFHGTKHYLLKSIFGTGDLLMPGDVTIDGVVIKPPPNHFQKSTAEFDIKRVFLSPSIKYAGCDVYAPKEDWTEADTRTKRKVRVALQVRIKPDSYAVGRETIGLKDRQMDEKFPNTELEWATAHRGAVILCGVLVKIEDWIEPSTTPIGSAATTSKSVIAQARGFDG